MQVLTYNYLGKNRYFVLFQRSFVSHTWLFEHFPTATLLLFAFMNSWLRCDFLAKIVSFMLLFWYYGAFFLLRKWFTIGLIFVILDAFMNFLDMSLQMMWMIKWFATRFTSVIFVAFMTHIYDLCGLHELYECVFLMFLVG